MANNSLESFRVVVKNLIKIKMSIKIKILTMKTRYSVFDFD